MPSGPLLLGMLPLLIANTVQARYKDFGSNLHCEAERCLNTSVSSRELHSMAQRAPSTRISRRLFLAGLTSLPVAGCGNQGFLDSFIDTGRFLTTGLPGEEFSRQYISDLPYATMRARIGNGPPVLVVLNTARNNNLIWLTGDNISLVTRAGRIVTVIGIPKAVVETAYLTPDPLADRPHLIRDAVNFSHTLTIAEKTQRKTYTIDSTVELAGEETIEILELTFDTFVLRERCEARYANWQFENYYWVDRQTGFVWRSRQYISREFRPISTEILKPAAV